MIPLILKTQYIDRDTGEVYAEKRKYVSPAFDEEKGYLFWVRKHNVRMFQDIDFPPELSLVDIGRLAKLSKKVFRDTNLLAYRGNGGVKPMSVDQIAEVIELKKRQAYNFLARMQRIGMIKKIDVPTKVNGKQKKVPHYYLNPIYFCSSNRINLNLYLLFQDQLDPLLPEWVKQKFAEGLERMKEAEGCDK